MNNSKNGKAMKQLQEWEKKGAEHQTIPRLRTTRVGACVVEKRAKEHRVTLNKVEGGETKEYKHLGGRRR